MVSTAANVQQLYSLTWSEYSTSLALSVQSLRGLGDLVDVTLAAGGRRFPAHKIVLSAASPFLLKLLKNTPCEHPMVMLAGVSAADLEALLEFVYRGEVSVDPEQLPSLLQAANCLGIQGLIPNAHTERSNNPHSASTLPATVSAAASTTNVALTRDVINSFLPLRRYKRPKQRSSETGSKWARLELENESGGPSAEHDNNTTPRPTANPDGDQLTAEEQADVATSAKSRGASDQPGVCPVCGATLRQARNLRRHLLTSCKQRANSLIDLHQYLHQSEGLDSNHSGTFTSGSEHIVCPVSPPPVLSPTIMCDNRECYMPSQHT